MQDYKIRIPNADISRQVQEKAFELGYPDWRAIKNSPIEFTDKPALWIDRLSMTYSDIEFFNEDNNTTEISYQDFLRLGEVDVNNCKIRLSELVQWINMVNFSRKLKDLNIKPYGDSNTIIRTIEGFEIHFATHNNLPDYMFIRDGKSVMCGTEYYFNQLPERELTVAEVMQLQPIINNTTTEIMSGEITLKCITAPQKAKNITVDRDYTGILTDSDDTQVDTLREATHFRCVNNNGIEAKYRLSLFATITPPPPPRPQFPTWEQIESNISVSGDGEVIVDFNDEEHIVFYNSYLDLEDCACCGLKEVNGIQNLYESIDRNCVLSLLQNQSDARRLKNLIFKKIIEDIITETAGAFKIFSIVSGYDEIDALMEEILAERGGVATEYTRSTSSGNDLKVFLIKV